MSSNGQENKPFLVSFYDNIPGIIPGSPTDTEAKKDGELFLEGPNHNTVMNSAFSLLDALNHNAGFEEQLPASPDVHMLGNNMITALEPQGWLAVQFAADRTKPFGVVGATAEELKRCALNSLEDTSLL